MPINNEQFYDCWNRHFSLEKNDEASSRQFQKLYKFTQNRFLCSVNFQLTIHSGQTQNKKYKRKENVFFSFYFWVDIFDRDIIRRFVLPTLASRLFRRSRDSGSKHSTSKICQRKFSFLVAFDQQKLWYLQWRFSYVPLS
jgi:hypothetical protein